MKKILFQSAPILLASVILAGCTDDKYDLDNINGDSSIRFENLTLPLNIDPVTLGDIIKIEEGSKLQIIDDSYVFIDNGDFHSDEIKIKEVKITPRPMTTQENDITTGDTGTLVTYDIYSSPSDFDFTDNNVTEDVTEITSFTSELPVIISLKIKNLSTATNALTFKNLRIQLPSNMTLSNLSAGSYDPKTGILSINHIKSTSTNGEIRITCSMTELDVVNCPEASFNGATHTFMFKGSMALLSGQLTIDKSLASGVQTAMVLQTSFNFGVLDLLTFTGRGRHTITGFNINPVDLADIPDFMSGEGTDLTLANPQIYLDINNPAVPYGAYGQAKLSITPSRDDAQGNPVAGTPIDMPNPFVISNSAVPTLLCLSPKSMTSSEYISGFENAVWNSYPGLGNILSGNGVPKRLNIDIFDSMMPDQPVHDMPLGRNIGQVTGKYEFYAPISFEGGSKIVYSKTEGEWDDEDVQKMIINSLDVTTVATNYAPLDVLVEVWPIDKAGNKIGNVHVEGAVIGAGKQNVPLTVHTTGEITGLDGFIYSATLLAPDGQNPRMLRPGQTVILNDVKVKATGSYNTTL